MSGKQIQLIFAGLLGFLVLVAFPAPSRVGVAEVAIALVAAGMSIHFFFLRQRFASLSRTGRWIGYSLVLYTTAWLISAVIGVINGVDTMGIIRSLLPQIIFVPVALLGLSLSNDEDARQAGKILIWIGALHGIYLLGLGVLAYTGAQAAADLTLTRITLIDPRTTMPQFLMLAPFGLAALAEGKLRRKLFGASAVLLCVAGALSTQTRAQLLAVFIAVLFFAFFFVLANPKPKVLLAAGVIAVLGIATVAILPPTRNLAMAVLTRQAEVGDNARIQDEWLPALDQWESRGTADVLFGIGLGVSIKDFSGEEKTYVHNQSIYTLVYTGVIGLVMITWMYFTAFVSLLVRYFRERSVIDLAAATGILTLWIYAQLFAVHKLFSFNLILFVLVAIALRKPALTREPVAVPVATKGTTQPS